MGRQDEKIRWSWACTPWAKQGRLSGTEEAEAGGGGGGRRVKEEECQEQGQGDEIKKRFSVIFSREGD
eukprot:749322-Hanusia_phi.AAC.4